MGWRFLVWLISNHIQSLHAVDHFSICILYDLWISFHRQIYLMITHTKILMLQTLKGFASPFCAHLQLKCFVYFYFLVTFCALSQNFALSLTFAILIHILRLCSLVTHSVLPQNFSRSNIFYIKSILLKLKLFLILKKETRA